VIVVDTSVWVSALRSGTSPEAKVLGQLLDADEVGLAVPVRLELLGGASNHDRVRLRRALSALPLLYPMDSTWQSMETWVERASAAGHRFGVGDLLIGALAHETGSLVWSLDADFARMSRLGFVALYVP
jgi:predicted nucleic acid-binding protein